MEKLDLVKRYKSYYSASKKPEMVEFGPVSLLAITGKGDPSGEVFSQKLAALFSVAYTLKFAAKGNGNDFAVPKLEAQWWFDEERFGQPTMEEAPLKVPRSEWEFRAMLRVPDFVISEDVNQAIELVIKKKTLEEARNITLFQLNEGRCVQMLHIGPFSTEPDSLSLIQTFSNEKQLKRNGLHHEIYLSDFRKTAPEALKTILREPVK